MTGLSARLAPQGLLAPAAIIAAVVITVLVGIVGSHLSIAIFVVAGIVLAGIVAAGSIWWPRPVLVIVALSPILDRYLTPGLLDAQAEYLAHFLSEGLLAVVAAILVSRAILRGTLRDALAHPAVALLGAFVLASIASALLNGVPAAQALAGIGFTLDAAVLFVLARIVGFNDRQAAVAIGAFVGLMLVAALVAIAQALLTPNLFGLYALQGRFGEIYRLASFFGDPNVFAALLSAAIPFTIFAILPQPTRGRAVLMGVVSAILVMALLLSFSRGGWLGAMVGFVVVGSLLDRRSTVIGLALVVAMFVTVEVMPRDLLSENPAPRPSLVDSTSGRVGAVGAGRDLRALFVVNAIPIVRDHPLLGVGPGRYGGAVAELFGTDVYAEYGTDELFSNPAQRTVDNFWLHLLGETGVIGLLAFAGSVGVLLVSLMRRATRAPWLRRLLLTGIATAVLSLVVNSGTTMLLESNSVAFLFWLMLGMGTTLGRDDLR